MKGIMLETGQLEMKDILLKKLYVCGDGGDNGQIQEKNNKIEN
jgi:hypothetical protein